MKSYCNYFAINKKYLYYSKLNILLKMSCIQLSYGIVCDNNQKKIKLNLLSNYKSEALFLKLSIFSTIKSSNF